MALMAVEAPEATLDGQRLNRGVAGATGRPSFTCHARARLPGEAYAHDGLEVRLRIGDRLLRRVWQMG